jgi:hypothetical protein
MQLGVRMAHTAVNGIAANKERDMSDLHVARIDVEGATVSTIAGIEM